MTESVCNEIFQDFLLTGDLERKIKARGYGYDEWLEVFEKIRPPESHIEYNGAYVFDLARKLFK